MWGVTILVTIKDLPLILTCQADIVSWMRGFFGVCGMAVNLWLQLTVLWYVEVFIVGQAVHDTQKDYAQYHREVFNKDGSFSPEKWHQWDGPYMALCNLAMSKMHFTVAIVFMWTARMLGEVRSIERLSRDIWAIPPLPNDAETADMLWEVKDDAGESEFRVIALSRLTRVSIYLLVIIPKLVIAAILMYIGCRWLAATESFSDLILNALALEFVIGTDELVYDNFAPQRMCQWLDVTKMQHVKTTASDISAVAKEETSEIVKVYAKSILYMVACGAWAFYYLTKIQQVIPGFTHDIHEHCGGWFLKRYQPPCPFGEANPGKCFPFGQ